MCIIQDDEVDWQLESKKMAKIYENSVFTISASAAPSGEYGCFTRTHGLDRLSSWAITLIQDFDLKRGGSERVSTELQRFNLDKTPITDENQFRIREYYGSKETISSYWRGGHIMAIFSPLKNNQVGLRVLPNDTGNGEDTASFISAALGLSSGIFVRNQIKHANFSADSFINKGGLPLFQRAWAFQERLLSSRVVHYTHSELVWECSTTSKCQCGRILAQDKLYHRGSTQINQALKPTFANSFMRNPTSDDLIDQWKLIVFHYSGMKLSRETDRLPALSGLAQRFKSRNIGTYVAGLWEKNLDTQLLWHTFRSGNFRNRSSTYIAPTWSWASLSTRVFFLKVESVHRGNDILQSTKIVGSILEAHCMPGGLDPLGSVVEGYLKVRGQMIQAILWTIANDMNEDERLDALAIGSFLLLEKPPYSFKIVNDDNSSWNFEPDSVSDIDVLTPRQPVFCLLWSLGPERDPTLVGNDDSFSAVLILRLSQRQPGNYERIGLVFRGAMSASKWFCNAKTVDITIV